MAAVKFEELDHTADVEVMEHAGIGHAVARLRPVGVIKG